MTKKVLLTYAIKEEQLNISLPDCEIIPVCTGIGKVKSTLALTDAIYAHHPDAVINVGSAGTLAHNVGDIYVCRSFIDRDFEALKIPGLDYTQETADILMAHHFAIDWQSQTPNESISFLDGVCNTGDDFVTQSEEIHGDVVDMEAYAQAYVCNEKHIPFIAIKFVTDIIGQNSVKSWSDKLADARGGLTKYLDGKPFIG
jgi:adenosylhomocysteine nucleosidase